MRSLLRMIVAVFGAVTAVWFVGVAGFAFFIVTVGLAGLTVMTGDAAGAADWLKIGFIGMFVSLAAWEILKHMTRNPLN